MDNPTKVLFLIWALALFGFGAHLYVFQDNGWGIAFALGSAFLFYLTLRDAV